MSLPQTCVRACVREAVVHTNAPTCTHRVTLPAVPCMCARARTACSRMHVCTRAVQQGAAARSAQACFRASACWQIARAPACALPLHLSHTCACTHAPACFAPAASTLSITMHDSKLVRTVSRTLGEGGQVHEGGMDGCTKGAYGWVHKGCIWMGA